MSCVSYLYRIHLSRAWKRDLSQLVFPFADNVQLLDKVIRNTFTFWFIPDLISIIEREKINNQQKLNEKPFLYCILVFVTIHCIQLLPGMFENRIIANIEREHW